MRHGFPLFLEDSFGNLRIVLGRASPKIIMMPYVAKLQLHLDLKKVIGRLVWLV